MNSFTFLHSFLKDQRGSWHRGDGCRDPKVNEPWPSPQWNSECLESTAGEGNGTPLQYSCLENPMDGGAGRLQSMGSRSQARLRDFTFTFHFHALEKEMATHSSVLACRIPGMVEPGGLPSLGSHGVGYD